MAKLTFNTPKFSGKDLDSLSQQLEAVFKDYAYKLHKLQQAEAVSRTNLSQQIVTVRDTIPTATPATVSEEIPLNAIFMWPASNPVIPDGYAICDGSNGTPDLQALWAELNNILHTHI